MTATTLETLDQNAVRSFVNESLLPFRAQLDMQQAIPRALIERIAERGYLGASIRPRLGGLGIDARAKCMLHEQLARAHGSLQNLVTVAAMAAVPLQRFGRPAVANEWLPAMAHGERYVAFAVTEPNTGSSLRDVQTRVVEKGDELIVDGEKSWISFAQFADGFVVLARADEGRTAALLIERRTPGLRIEPIRDMLGLRANMLGRVSFDACRVPRDHLLGPPSEGVAAAILFGLDEGRFCTACGSLGIAQASLDLALAHVQRRSQGGGKLHEHQLVQKMLTEMIVAVKASRLLCYSAADARDGAAGDMLEATLMAKYHASQTARLAADHAVQLLGALGCHAGAEAERLFRDAKMMEIIEGTTQVHEMQIALSHLKTITAGGGL
jgi:alkylation response protein AidB-like acyl-CoA dehydrogenase